MIDALLEHLGIADRPAPDAAGLARVHRAFLSTLAYDGLTAQLGEHAPLDPDALIARTLATGRGGYCFEINTILLTLLVALGFAVERREGIVGPPGAAAQGEPTNHLALVASTAAGESYICDAGWGEGPLEPIALADGRHHAAPAPSRLAWDVTRHADGRSWWVAHHAWGTNPGFRFGDDARPLSAFAPHHERLALDPGSTFVQTLVVQRPTDTDIITLRSRTLSRKGPDVDERRVLDDADDLAATLRDVFAIDPEALGAERVARLWTRAQAQHSAFLTRHATAPPAA